MRELSAEKVDKLKAMSRGSGLETGSEDASSILEAMFLMAVADGEVSDEEMQRFADSIEVLVEGASEADLEGMLAEMSSLLEEQGKERRSRAVAAALKGKPGAEVAFRLATAVAFVDDAVATEESDLLDEMAMAMDISSDRAHEIMSEVHRTLFG
jgi:tellurite resistance protein